MDEHARLYEFLKSHSPAAPVKDGAPSAPPSGQADPGNREPAAVEIPGFERIGEYTYRRRVREADPLSGLGTGPLLSAGAPARDLLFFDTETTGLSGGAGNLAFLLGAGYCDEQGLVIEQYFLADFPGEAEFLSLIAPLFSPERTFVSYNGAAFDAHLLISRFRLHRLELALPRQYDLLHPSRRLWKAAVAPVLGSCSLKNMEKAVLDVDRGEDIDGAEVPEFYFRFLRTGLPDPLDPVFYHNHIDVRSLTGLLFTIESLLRAPETANTADGSGLAADTAALGVMLHHVDPDRAAAFLQTRWDSGDAACGRVLGYYLKRSRAHEAAARIWEALFALPHNLEPGLELAKYLEHHAYDPGRALAVVRALLEQTESPAERDRLALEKRRKRLERKLFRRRSPEE